MERADLNDLCRELWLRKRNSGELKWVTKEGKEIPIKDLTDSHLENIIKLLVRKEEFNEIAAEYAAYIDSKDLMDCR